ncbi:hypothetical protein ACS0TY_006678 [Phlomoides rotata]
MLWNKFAPVKASAAAWTLLWDRLPTKLNLQRRRILESDKEVKCDMCGEALEMAKRLFFECKVANEVWNGLIATAYK